MSIEKDLKKEGIEVINKLDTLSINSLASAVANKLCRAFPNEHFVYQNLFINLSRLPMYVAKIPEGLAEANYFYKNSSVYFKDGLTVDELEKFAVHEFIHHIQEIKDNKGNLLRLGLCEIGDFKTYGLGLNEAAVQLASSKALNQKEDVVKYYGISLPTKSPIYYPIICNLLEQLIYITGEDTLWDSMFNCTDTFKETCIELLGENNFLKIQDNFDKILDIEEKIITMNNNLMNDDLDEVKAHKISLKIENQKSKLKETFFNTQNLIFSSYFDREFNKIHTTNEIDLYRMELYNYKNYLGISEDYNAFNDYYINKMIALDERYTQIINNVALVPIKNSVWSKLFKSISKLFGFNSEKNYNYQDK